MKKTLVSLFACTLFLCSVHATERHRLTTGWQFIRQDMANAWEVFRPVQAGKPESVPLWQEVRLPHCFNATDAVDPDVNYYQGSGWYRTRLHVQNPYVSGHTLLEFEGCGQKTEVYVGLRRVGTHVGGYDRWQVDITAAVDSFLQTGAGDAVPVAVRCDNSRDTEMIPSDMSDFNLYGGLYRHVNLVYQPEDYLSEDIISVRDHQIVVDAPATAQVQVVAPDGKVVYDGSNARPVQVRKPQLWDVDAPRLYTVRVRYGSQQIERRVGFRTYEFREHGPFYLNGRRLLLQGTHRHEDHAGVGAAMTDEMTRRELCQIKEMGANFIRLGHYQQSDFVLQLCDSLGLLVWEEVPWCRGGLGGGQYRQQARRMLTNMIQQHRHHPSVILWGLGNENDWPGDFPVFSKDSIRAFMVSQNALAHQLDPTRLTTIRRCDFCADVVDVYSPTIWAGWYSSRFTDYRQMEQAAIDKYPRFFHAEWGGDSHARRHAEGSRPEEVTAADRNGDWSESHIIRLFDWHLKEQLQMPALTGTAFWTFKDFSTPLRPDNPIPYVNQKGVVERDGTPKESYYVFQAYWASKPMLHIYGHSWPVRWGKPDEPKEILVYSNCPEVELFVNGVSQGRRRRNPQDYPAQGFHWNVPLREGANVIRAVAGRLTDEITQEYQTQAWKAPARLQLTHVSTQGDTMLVAAQLIDDEGIRCLDAANRISFSVAGDACLLDNQGTSTGTRRIQASNGRALIRLRKSGPCVVSASASGIPAALLPL